jgi:hypothetical protein
MKASTWLRLASIVSFIFALGHTFGGTKSWSPLGETPGLVAMRTFQFQVGAVQRTYLDFYLGFGFMLSVFMLLQAVLLWQIAAIAKDDPRRARPLAGSILVAQLACGALCWRYIFVGPVVFSAAISICLAVAVYLTGRSPNRVHVTP